MERNKGPKLAELLHAVMPVLFDEYRIGRVTKNSSFNNLEKKVFSKDERQQEEIVNGKKAITCRYGMLFECNEMLFEKEIDNPYPRKWPCLNLYVEKGLAEIVDRIIGLEGKTVVSVRPEYYPFFGVQAARKGAKSILVDGRTITEVADLINGTMTYSHDIAQRAKQKLIEGTSKTDVIASEEKVFLGLPKDEIVASIVRNKLHITRRVWDNLTELEKRFYIFEWIDKNPGFSLAANQYFGGANTLSGRKEHQPFNIVPENQSFPYVLRMLEENFDSLISRDTNRVARDLVKNKVSKTLSNEEKFSWVIEDIYLELLSDKFMRNISNGDEVASDGQIQNDIVEIMFQTKKLEEHKKIKANLDYRYGMELGQANISDQSVDVIFSGWGLDYLENSVDFITHISRVTKEKSLFVGYVEEDNMSMFKRKRDLGNPTSLRKALQVCGFDDIVIVKRKYDKYHSRKQEIGLVYFAKKSYNPKASLHGLLPVVNIPQSELFQRTQKEDLLLKPTVQPMIVSKTLNSDVSLDELVSVFSSSPNDIRLATRNLYGLEFNELEIEDLKNVIRGLYCKYENIGAIRKNLPKFSERFDFVLEQYFQKQNMVSLIAQDLNEAFNKMNRCEDTSDIEQTIAQKTQTLGAENINVLFQKIKEILACTKLSSEVQNGLDKAQEEVTRALEKEYKIHNNPNEDYYKSELWENQIFYTSIERRKQMSEITKALYNYFLAYDYSFYVNLDDKSTIKTSIGRIHKVAKFAYYDRIHEVLFVDQNIAMMDKQLQALYTNALESIHHKRFVFLDRVQAEVQKFLDTYGKTKNLPALIQREWGDLQNPQTIVNDISQHASIHEIQHGYNTGELGSYLAELAFGRTPYYALSNEVAMLFELADDKHMGYLFASMLKAMEIFPESEHLHAAATILPHYLDLAVQSGRLGRVLEEKIRRLYSINATGHSNLNREKALQENRAVMDALAYLEKEEIQNLASNILEQRFGMKFERTPTELTANFPLIVNDNFVSEIKQTNLAIMEKSYNFNTFLTLAVREAGYISDKTTQSKQLTELVDIVGDSDIDEALNIARTMVQRFQKEKALLALAYKAVEKGDNEKAFTILREAETLIDDAKKGISPNFSFYCELGDAFILYPELTDLKTRLGLQDEIYDLFTRIEGQFMQDHPEESRMLGYLEYLTLLDIAKRKNTIGYRTEAIGTLGRVEEIMRQNKSKYFKYERSLLEISVAKADITGTKEIGKAIVNYMINENWAEGVENYKWSLDALARLGCRSEIIDETDRIFTLIKRNKEIEEQIDELEAKYYNLNYNDSQKEIISERIRKLRGSAPCLDINIGFIFNSLADALYQVGEKKRARQLWNDAHQCDLNEAQRAEHEYDWGFDRQAATMSKYPELLDEAVQISMNIQDFTMRADSLIEIGKQYLAHAQAEKGLVVLRRAEQYLNDSSRKANIRLLVEQELVKLRRCYFGDHDEKQIFMIENI